MQVTLVDEEKNPGGVCLYRGCIPSKALLHVAKVIDEASHAGKWGVSFRRAEDRRRQAARLQTGRRRQADGRRRQRGEAAQGQVPAGTRHADRAASMTIAGATGPTELQFEHLILATGSSADEDSVALARQPAHARLDVGARAAGRAEVAAGRSAAATSASSSARVYATLGSKVSVVEMTPGLLPGADRDLVAVLEKRLKRLFAAHHARTRRS